MKDRKRGTMGMIPALATAVILGIGANQDHGCVATREEHTMAVSGILRE